MSYTTNDLITGAYYAAGVVSREFETVSGGQLADGLQFLNDILTEKRVDEGMIPYETTYTFNGIVGQEIYFIPNLIEIDTLTFFLSDVRYSMVYDKRNHYFGGARVNNINTLPFNWYFERVTGGGNLYIYFTPDQTYPMEVHGIFGLATVTPFQNLSANETVADLGIPTFYGQGTLNPGQFIISTTTTNSTTNNGNGYNFSIDLVGNYDNIGSLINYINSGIIPGIQAQLVVNDFVLYSITNPPVPIYIRTNGYAPNGTRFIGNVAAATTVNLSSTYFNGVSGIGANLTALVPSILVVDGYTLQNPNPITNQPDRVLVKNQTDPTQNGSYIISSVNDGSVPWVLTRTTNYDQPVQIKQGDIFTSINGTINSGLSFIQTLDVSDVGISPINFIIFNAIDFSNFSLIQQPNYQVFNPGGFDQFYLTYLRYALADRICAEYNYVTPLNVLRQLGKYESWITKKSRLLDLRQQKSSTLQKRQTYGWAWINLGRGWTTSD